MVRVVEDHAAGAAQFEDGLTDIGRACGRAQIDLEPLGEAGEPDRPGLGRLTQPVGDSEDEVAVGVLEDRLAMAAETALLVRPLAHCVRPPVVDGDRLEQVRGLRAVCADVLHRSGPDRPRNSRQGLEAGQPLIEGGDHQRVPVDARIGPHDRAVDLDAAGSDADREPVPAVVADDQVRAAAHHQQRHLIGVGLAHQVEQVAGAGGFGELAGRPAHPHRGEVAKRGGHSTPG